ncbi:MAG: SAM-dependent chlorinase/fluorinase, partial [Anaerolineae bacterium]|nr:SAM-dependent chlorinase/fluorinase [Anaerolineae bacterium]
RLVDLTHTSAPQNVRQAAYVLLTAYRYFPPDTVFLIVVDPGVGTTRHPIAVQTERGYFVAPDNGVLSYVLAHTHAQRVVSLDNPAYQLTDTSQTFHGRDIFSPAAAHLAAGVAITALGPTLDTWHTLPQPKLTITPTRIHGEVLHVDHFGNVITSIGQLRWTDDTLQLDPAFGHDHPIAPPTINAATSTVTVGQHTLHTINRTYGAVAPGTLTALIGSTGQLEIGVNQGHAAHTLDVQSGDLISLILAS